MVFRADLRGWRKEEGDGKVRCEIPTVCQAVESSFVWVISFCPPSLPVNLLFSVEGMCLGITMGMEGREAFLLDKRIKQIVPLRTPKMHPVEKHLEGLTSFCR